MNLYKIYKENGNTFIFCGCIKARNEKSALRKHRKTLISTGEYIIKKGLHHYWLYSSYGGYWMATKENVI